jgi:hypothetical protein
MARFGPRKADAYGESTLLKRPNQPNVFNTCMLYASQDGEARRSTFPNVQLNVPGPDGLTLC